MFLKPEFGEIPFHIKSLDRRRRLVVERRQHDDDKAPHDTSIGIAGKVPATILAFLSLQPGLALAAFQAVLFGLPLGRQGGQLLAELDDESVLVLPAVGGGKLLADGVSVGLKADLGIGC